MAILKHISALSLLEILECTPVFGQIRLEWSDRDYDDFGLETSFQIPPGVYNPEPNATVSDYRSVQ